MYAILMLTWLGVYWWDPWHTIYSSTMDPSWVYEYRYIQCRYSLCVLSMCTQHTYTVTYNYILYIYIYIYVYTYPYHMITICIIWKCCKGPVYFLWSLLNFSLFFFSDFRAPFSKKTRHLSSGTTWSSLHSLVSRSFFSSDPASRSPSTFNAAVLVGRFIGIAFKGPWDGCLDG